MENYNDDYIFCFLDILGFKDFVLNKKNLDKLEDLKESFKAMTVEMPKFFSDFHSDINDPEQVEMKKCIDKVIFSIISDSILIRAPLKLINDKENYQQLWVFIHLVSFFILNFISMTGKFLRGGISIGQHYETTLIKNENQFIFSEALIKAYLLEQSAASIRIIVDDEIKEFLIKHDTSDSPNKIIDYIYTDYDNKCILNFYNSILNPGFIDDYLNSIVIATHNNVISNKNNLKILSKYISFIRYHNDIALNKFSKAALKIDMNIFN